MTKDAVINAFNFYYEEALKKNWIKKKLSWALHQTWKWCDENEGEKNDRRDEQRA